MNAYTKPSGVAGSGLFSSQNVGPGELLFTIARPLIAVLDSKRLAEVCSWCFAEEANTDGNTHGSDADVINVKACTGCRTVRYCSKQCQVNSWRSLHKHECKLLGGLSARGMLPSTSRAILQMLHSTFNATMSPFQGMTSHLDEIARIGGERYETYLALSTGIHHYSGTRASVDMVLQCYGLIQTNSFTLMAPTFDPLGLILDPFAAKANHSCDPNAFIVFDGATMSFRSLKRIAKDEEIFVSYIDSINPFHRRQEELKDRYFFTCKCSKCAQGPTLSEDKFLENPATMKRGWDKHVKIMPGSFEEFAKSDLNDLANHIGDDTNSATLEAQQWLAFKALENAQAVPSETDIEHIGALRFIKQGIDACLQTSIWPDHRQPLPSLRQEAFTKLLMPAFNGLSWSFAFKQGLKLYFDIHPALYPETFHPGRVAHKWAMAKLALLLADPETVVSGDLAEVDFGVVAYGWLMEVGDNVRLSHGMDSAFAKNVLGKQAEVVMDMGRGDGALVREIGERIAPQWGVLRRLAGSEGLDSWMGFVE